jgi:hypothetical protein
MFAYNELSDLLTGELVTPLRMDSASGKVICLTSTGSEVLYSFSDFDFDKTIEDRTSSSTTMEEAAAIMAKDASSTTETSSLVENFSTTIKINYVFPEEKLTINYSYSDDEKKLLLKQLGYSYDDIKKVNIVENFKMTI